MLSTQTAVGISFRPIVRVPTVFNSTQGRAEGVSRLLQMHANRWDEVSEVAAGDIAAAVGLHTTTTGDTLCDERAPIVLEAMRFEEPVISRAIEPNTDEDQARLALALHRLGLEDPTFRCRIDDETGQTIISGMGELHLEILVDRMRREFQVNAAVGRPQVSYRETVATAVEQEYLHDKQAGGRAQFAHTRMRIEPNEKGQGNLFIDATRGDEIPHEFFPAIAKGFEMACDRGALAGFPLVDVKCTLTDAQFSDGSSTAMAFELCASMNTREAAERARPVLLEPIMAVEIATPEDYLGAVIGDITARRGQVRLVSNLEPRGGVQTIAAEVPLSTMFGYSTDLRSATQGRATYTMQFAHHAPVPGTLADEIVSRMRGA